ncbi:MAG TPA: DUF5666 domain-containing protein [Variovorax sp.]|nr:DUF5666 domain-containing protein [Variovorax sp.]
MIGKYKLLRAGLGVLSLAFLLSCGGGSEVSGGSVSGHFEGNGFTIGGSSGGNGSNGDSTGGNGGASGNASTGNDGSTTTAGNGNDDGSGVGSGGTGVSTADAGTVGSVDGMGSIIVGGLRYNDDNAVIDRPDADAWQLGMTVAVTGPVDSDFATGTAQRLKSRAQMRGAVGTVDVANGSFQMLGSTVSVDDETVWADLVGLSGLVTGAQVKVWALPVSPGLLRATRIESQVAAATTLVTGTVKALNSANKTFQLGGLVIGYGAATLPAEGVVVDRIVRVEAMAPPSGGRLEATQVEGWYALTSVQGAAVQLEGVIDQFASKGNFKLMGVTIDASSAQVTGGQESKLNNGVKVVASGTLSAGGVLVASKLKIRHVPGEGALTKYYDVHGTIESFQSPSDMRVRSVSGGVQKVDVSAALVSGAGQLQNGQKVRVQGSQVIRGVLQVTQLTYE